MTDTVQLPVVVAVVVTHDPGDWFEATLQGLAAQEHPNLRCLVLDTAPGPTPDSSLADRVHAVLPDAFVRQVSAASYGQAVNASLQLVAGSGFLCLMHDDVALDPSAIRLLLEEAYRSNAGIAAPKLVTWDDPGLLVDVGSVVDKFGEAVHLVEPGERDQEQHDAVADRFTVSSACLLVRSDLLRTLGGFDERMQGPNDDLDLCWRAHLSGARVLIVPGAVARHRQDPERSSAHGFTRDARRLAERNRLRAVFTNYSLVHLARVLPQLVVISVLSFVGYLATGRLSKAMALADAWWWNLRSLPSIIVKHRSGTAIRKVPDGDIRRLQQHGSARLAAFLRGKARQRAGAEVAASGRHFIDGARAGANWLVIAGWTALLAFFALASRDLITGRVPVAGGLVPELGTLGEQVAGYLSGWRPHGLGQTAPPPSMVGMLSALSAVFLGQTGAVRLVVTIGPIVLGWVGMWSLTRPFEEGRARLAAVGVYALVPLAGAAMSDGRWSSVAMYAAAPWLLSQLLRSTGIAPFGEPFGWPRRLMPAVVARVAVIVAIVASLAPVVLVVLPLLAVVLAASLLVTGGRKAALRVVIAGVLGPVIGVVLLVPFAIGRSGLWAAWSQRNRSSLTTADVLRFDLADRWWLTGPLVTVAALLAVAAAQGWRLAWAVRFAVCVLGGSVVSVLVARGSLPFGSDDLVGVVSFSLAALAALAGLGLLVLHVDVRGHRLTWRQPAFALVGLGLVVAVVPGVAMASDGRWGAPAFGATSGLRALRVDDATAFRVLWLGERDTLPATGWALSEPVWFAMTTGTTITPDDRWPTPKSEADELVAASINVASAGSTNRLGRLLGPFGIRYIALMRSTPAGVAPSLPAGLVARLRAQLDVRELSSGDDRLVLFENMSWLPIRAQLGEPAAKAAASTGFSGLVGSDLASSAVVMRSDAKVGADGEVGPGTVFISQMADSRWRLTVDGDLAAGAPAFGWATAYQVEQAGTAALRYDTANRHRLLVAMQVALWIGVLWFAGRRPRAVAAAAGSGPIEGDGPALVSFPDPVATESVLAAPGPAELVPVEPVPVEPVPVEPVPVEEVPVEQVEAPEDADVLDVDWHSDREDTE